MDTATFTAKYAATVEQIKADYLALAPLARRFPKTAKQHEIVRAAAALRVGTVVSIARLGITAEEARELARAGVVNAHPDRQRKLAAISLKGR